MKYSQLFGKTQKSAKEFQSKNATLLQKGGFINQTMAGVYSFLPLGLRVLAKIEQIVREEMNTVGQEVFMPAIAPKELWEQTGRLETVDVLLKVSGANKPSQERNNAEYILNPTHEDVVTPLAKEYNLTYKDFPLALYQIQSKFRNEPRAKSGLLRGREFRMKDLYSFHTSEEDFKRYYEEVKPVYMNVYKRVGLGEYTHITLASGGDFTDDFSHEFQTICEAGEDTIFRVPSTGVVFNREVAPSKAPAMDDSGEDMKEREDVVGKGIIGVEALAEFLKIAVAKTTKTILFETETGDVVAAAVRGGYDINEEKLKKIVGCKKLTLARAEVVREVTKAEVGYAGILDLPESVKVYLDDSMQGRRNFECGANKTDYHSININFGRDIPEPEKFYDFKNAMEGDMYPETGEVYEMYKAAEVGNIFPLGDKYTKAIDYKFVDTDGERKTVYMGSYGIGTSRLMGVIAEIFNDDKGLNWPIAVAPFQVHLVSLGKEGEPSLAKAEEMYQTLQAEGIEVLFDDRQESAGSKFADSDLIGIPIRIVISMRTLEKGEAEVKLRSEEAATMYKLEGLEMEIDHLVKKLRDAA